MTTKANADKIAAAFAALVIVAGGALIICEGPEFDPPTKTTAVHEVSSGAGVGKTTTTTKETPGQGNKEGSTETTTTVEEPTGEPSEKITTTTEIEARSFGERALGDSGLLLLQIGVLILAAFFAGAFVQRLLLGQYVLKIGPVELGAIESTEKITAGVADMQKLQKEQAEALQTLAEKTKDLQTATLTIGTAVTELRERVAKIEKKKKKGKSK